MPEPISSPRRTPDILADYAWLLYSQDPSNTKGAWSAGCTGSFSDSSPTTPGILVSGFEAYQRKDFRSAVQYWERLLAQLEPGSEEAQHLARAIASAKERLGSK